MERKIPFETSVNTLNRKILEAIAKIKEMKKDPNKYKKYSSFLGLLDELSKDAMSEKNKLAC